MLLAASDNVTARISASTRRIEALSQSAEAYINRGSKIIEAAPNLTLDDRALEYVLQNARLEQRNRERVLEYAVEDLEHHQPVEDAQADIDPDWLNVFARVAGEKSDEQIRHLWGRILSGEIRSPGSISLRTLMHLASYDKRDAAAAYDLLRYAVDETGIFVSDDKTVLPFGIVLRGSEIGLITLSTFGASVRRRVPGDASYVAFRFHEMAVLVSSNQEQELDYPVYPFTAVGRDLLKLAPDLRTHTDYVTAFGKHARAKGFEVMVGKITAQQGGRLTVDELTEVAPDGQA